MSTGVLLLAAVVGLPFVAAAPCDCATTWTYGGTRYSGCQTTRDSLVSPWCIVEDGAKCTAASQGYDATSNANYSYVTCDTGVNASKACECSASWTDPAAYSWTSDASTCGTTQSGCPDVACDNRHAYASSMFYSSWCVVGNAPCASAPAGLNGNEAYMICTPTEKAGACDCQSSWSYNGTTYSGCQTTRDSPGAPWCAVGWTCGTGLYGYDPVGGTSFRYKQCTDGLDTSKACTCSGECVNGNTTYCVVGNAPCATAPAPGSGVEAYASCTPTVCECLGSWEYKGVTYKGCQTTPDSPGSPWCYVDDACLSANARNDTAGITGRWRTCTDGTDGTVECACEAGSCVDGTPAYCAVSNAPCATAPKGDNTAGNGAYGTCVPSPECDCLGSWTWNGVQYAGCVATPDSNSATWCAVPGTCRSGSTGQDSTGQSVTWRACTKATACDCLASWEYNGATYSGCQTTMDSPGAPWCRVDVNCPNATWGTDPSDQSSIAYMQCTDGLDASKECTCSGQCVDGATPYCEVGNAPCKTAPAPSSGVKAYASCTPVPTPSPAPTLTITTPSPAPTLTITTPSATPTLTITTPSATPTRTFPTPTSILTPNRSTSCPCLPLWKYKGKTYSGCQTTHDSPGIPWCPVDEACQAAQVRTDDDGHRVVYTTCSDGIDARTGCICSEECVDAAVPYCKVANPPCRHAPEPSSGVSAYIPCVPKTCECLPTWEYKGVSYEGCQTTPDSPSAPWCFTSGSCKSAFPPNSTAGVPFPWRYCSDGLDPTQPCECDGECTNEVMPSCPVKAVACTTSPKAAARAVGYATCIATECSRCKADWVYEGHHYKGCGASDGEGLWCELDDRSTCAAARTRQIGGSTLRWARCTPTQSERRALCACKVSWVYRGVVYTGCQTTPDSPGRPWCPVASPGCPDAFVHHTGKIAARYCTEGVDPKVVCVCAHPCRNALDGAWCQVRNAPCKEVPQGPKPYARCIPEPCTCMPSWEWKGTVQSGCAFVKGSFDDDWCPVKGGVECNSARVLHDKEGRKLHYITGCSRGAATEDVTGDDDAGVAVWVIGVAICGGLACVAVTALVVRYFSQQSTAVHAKNFLELDTLGLDPNEYTTTDSTMMTATV